MFELWHSLIGALPFEWASYGFMRQALLAVFILAPTLALIGALVVHQRMAFFSEAIGHGGLTGVAIGVFCGLGQPMWAMICFAILLAVAIGFATRFSRAPSDTLIGAFTSFALALGIVILSHGGNFNRYTSYLVGDILSITPSEIAWLALVSLISIACVILIFNRILFWGLNPSLSESRKCGRWLDHLFFSILVAVVVTLSLPWIGILVVNALLILPALAARNLARNTVSYVWLAVGLSLASCISGLLISYAYETATGATIVLVAMMFFITTLALKPLLKR